MSTLRRRDPITDIVDAVILSTSGRSKGNPLTGLVGEIETLYQEAGIEREFEETLCAWRQAVDADVKEPVSAKQVSRLLKRIVEDARDNGKLVEAFKKRHDDESTPFLLGQFLCLPRLSKEKADVVRQAIVLMEQFNAHLPFKRARYAIDPVQRLQMLADRLPALTEREFHAEMIETFKELRDAHTFYSLPRPYRGHVAFLPFLLEDCAGDEPENRRRYLVTNILPGLPSSEFGRGVEVTHWNGVPVEKAVLDNADREPGNNHASRLARGLARLTVRPLAFTLPPDEDWITITYLPRREPDDSDSPQPRQVMIPWGVWKGRSRELFGRAAPLSSSVCESVTESTWRAKPCGVGKRMPPTKKCAVFAGALMSGRPTICRKRPRKRAATGKSISPQSRSSRKSSSSKSRWILLRCPEETSHTSASVTSITPASTR